MSAVVSNGEEEEPDEAKILGMLMASARNEVLRDFAESVLTELDPDLFVRREAIALAAILKDSIGEEDVWTVKGINERVKEVTDDWDSRLPEFVLEAREAAAGVLVERFKEEVLEGLEAIRRRRDREGGER